MRVHDGYAVLPLYLPAGATRFRRIDLAASYCLQTREWHRPLRCGRLAPLALVGVYIPWDRGSTLLAADPFGCWPGGVELRVLDWWRPWWLLGCRILWAADEDLVVRCIRSWAEAGQAAQEAAGHVMTAMCRVGEYRDLGARGIQFFPAA